MIKDSLSRIKELILKRKRAYQMVFDKDNVFTSDVLKDLAKFCRAYDSTFHKDERMHAVLEGRREVWLRIQENLNLDVDQIYLLHRAIDLAKEHK